MAGGHRIAVSRYLFLFFILFFDFKKEKRASSPLTASPSALMLCRVINTNDIISFVQIKTVPSDHLQGN